ncbi:MAG: GTPase ObgE [Proteobacteria bacterium]|nr:GTPase ObgE [Pseudomonadota bacterium]
MRFIDETVISVESGKGGDGAATFRRERFVPFGGPDGGDGGKGGDVVLVATNQLNTLLSLRGRSHFKAKSGQPGRSRNCTGAGAATLTIKVPTGTRVIDNETGEEIVDLVEHGQVWVAAKGGLGGLGNTHFKSSVNQAPRKFSQGKPGELKRLRLELILMADVGLVGFPNAGKSTLVASLSAARPKIADYPFTTLAPSLGVVDMGVEGQFVVADIPGLVRGASEGIGLGHQFLRHVRRNKMLLHLLSMDPTEEETPLERYKAIRDELSAFDAELTTRQEIIVLTKCDLLFSEEDAQKVHDVKKELCSEGEQRKPTVVEISSATRDGLQNLKEIIWTCLNELNQSKTEQIKEELKEKGVAFLLEKPPHEEGTSILEERGGPSETSS